MVPALESVGRKTPRAGSYPRMEGDMPNKYRRGKITNGGHSTTVLGLRNTLAQLESWDEIDVIRLGAISRRDRGGSRTLRATRWAMVGDRVIGIKCEAARGSVVQVVVLLSSDPEALRKRLKDEGYEINW